MLQEAVKIGLHHFEALLRPGHANHRRGTRVTKEAVKIGLHRLEAILRPGHTNHRRGPRDSKVAAELMYMYTCRSFTSDLSTCYNVPS